MSGSEYATVAGSGAKMLPSKTCAGSRGNVCAIHAMIQAFSWASALWLSETRHGALAIGHV